MLGYENILKSIYCDTDSLFSNPKRHKEDAKAQREAAAISRLLDYHRSGKLTMQRSNVALRELEETGNPIQQDNLRRDFLELVPIAKDEKVLGFDNLQSDPYGGFVSNPIISDVQEEPLAERLESQGLPKRDAQHLAQAISNNADVSLHGMSLTSSTSVRRSKSNSKSRFGVHRNYCWKSKRQLNYVPTTNESKRSCLDSYRFLERPLRHTQGLYTRKRCTRPLFDGHS